MIDISQYRFKMDLLGIFIAILGAITVVLSTTASYVRLNPQELVRAISQRIFVIYSLINVIGAIALAILSEGRIGRQWVFVDIGLCALFGERLRPIVSSNGVLFVSHRWFYGFVYKGPVHSNHDGMVCDVYRVDHVSHHLCLSHFIQSSMLQPLIGRWRFSLLDLSLHWSLPDQIS